MKTNEFKFTTDQNTELHVYEWLPDSDTDIKKDDAALDQFTFNSKDQNPQK